METDKIEKVPIENTTQRTSKPIVAGILDIIMGIGFVGYIIAAYFGYGRSLLAFAWLPLAIPPIVGGICALRRKIWLMAIAGSILTLPFGLPAIILIVMSKKEFTE